MMNAEALLQKILAENHQAGYPNLDRSREAIRERQRYQNQIQQKNVLEGIENPLPKSLEGRLITHFIAGDISAAQMVKVLREGIAS